MVATSPISAAGGLATLGAPPGKLARGLAGLLRRQAIIARHLGKFAQVRWKLFYLLAMIGGVWRLYAWGYKTMVCRALWG